MNEELLGNENIDGKRIKRGRKKAVQAQQESADEVQSKFFIDLRKEPESLQMILNVLKEANKKNYGREIILKDLVLASIPKLTNKDLEKIQEQSLSEMERVQRFCDEFNEKNCLDLSLGEFLVKKFNL